ncbi:MAG TPA: hypothetical protein VL092_07795, partial [Chitinophagaceae bacterium]|nr:hypothetical protein [Chitinophagaceae bacterium]
MKKALFIVALALSAAVGTRAQAPQLFNYQGVARNSGGTALASTPIGLRISILDGGPAGTVVYQETHATTTNAFGLYNVAIGSGTVVSGAMAGIEWSTGNKYMQVEIDPAGGTSYSALGST